MTPAQTDTPRTMAYYDHKDRKRPLASQEDRPFCEELERELSHAVKVAGESHGTEAGVCADIARRQRTGMNKYGVSVAENPLELQQWLQHAYEECLDQAVYLKRALSELQRIAKP